MDILSCWATGREDAYPPKSPPRQKPPLLCQREAELGIEGCRLSINGFDIHPTPDVWTWDKLDADIQSLEANGQFIYLNVVNFPAHMSGGAPTYEEGVYGCLKFVGQSVVYADDRPYCVAPLPKIAGVDVMAEQIVLRYGSRIKWIGVGNENDSQDWPPSHIEIDGDWQPSMRTFFDDFSAPFAEGVRRGWQWRQAVVVDTISPFPPMPELVGPETMTMMYAIDWLRRERETGIYVCDRISTHHYAFAERDAHGNFLPDTLFPLGALKRTREFRAGIAPLRNGRPDGIGEIGREHDEPPETLLRYIPAIKELGEDHVAIMGLGDHYANQETWEPNEHWFKLRTLLRQMKGRHRGARP